jgi:hypothetical protein
MVGFLFCSKMKESTTPTDYGTDGTASTGPGTEKVPYPLVK